MYIDPANRNKKSREKPPIYTVLCEIAGWRLDRWRSNPTFQAVFINPKPYLTLHRKSR